MKCIAHFQAKINIFTTNISLKICQSQKSTYNATSSTTNRTKYVSKAPIKSSIRINAMYNPHDPHDPQY